ncbi:MAG: hypothetical protein ACK54C_15095 [Betaproteobacteria bacterium]
MAKASADGLQDVILKLVPLDGSSVGNQTLYEQVRQGAKAAGIAFADPAYEAARQRLIAAGTLTKGKGRGGSVRLARPLGDGFALAPVTPVAAPQATRVNKAPVKTTSPAKSGNSGSKRAGADDDATVVSYRHGDKRKNNPEVGLVSEKISRTKRRPYGATTRTWTRPCSSTWAARRWNG